MARMVKRLSNLEIDEVSLVDRPANQHGLVAFAKADSQEDNMPVFDADGQEIYEDELQPGDYVYDENGAEFQVVEDGDGDVPNEQYGAPAPTRARATSRTSSLGSARRAGATCAPVLRCTASGRGRCYGAALTSQEPGQGRRPTAVPATRAPGRRAQRATPAGVQADIRGAELVGRSRGIYGLAAGAAGWRWGLRCLRLLPRPPGAPSKSMGDQVLESLSKALTEDDRDEVIAKALGSVEEIAKRNDDLEDAIQALIEDRELEQYSELAKSYGLSGTTPTSAGCSTAPPRCSRRRTSPRWTGSSPRPARSPRPTTTRSATAVRRESDTLGQIYAMAGDAVAKSDMGMSEEQAITALFDANPAAYDEYMAEQGYGR